MKSIQKFRSLHLGLGLALLVPLIFASLTGFFLGAAEPYVAEQTKARTLSPDTAVELAQKDYPEYQFEAFRYPGSGDRLPRLKILHPKIHDSKWIYFHLDKEQIFKVEPGDHKTVYEWVNKIHRGSWAGQTGKILMSLVGVLVFGLWGLGICYFTKRVKARVSGKITYLRIHRWLGVYPGALISIVGLTGASINFSQELIRIFDPIPSYNQPSYELGQFALQPFLDKAKEMLPNVHPESIHLLRTPQALLLIYFENNSRIYFNPYSHEVIKSMTPNTHWVHSLYLLHSGKIFSGYRTIFIILTSGILLTLLVSGFFLTPFGKKASRLS